MNDGLGKYCGSSVRKAIFYGKSLGQKGTLLGLGESQTGDFFGHTQNCIHVWVAIFVFIPTREFDLLRGGNMLKLGNSILFGISIPIPNMYKICTQMKLGQNTDIMYVCKCA